MQMPSHVTNGTAADSYAWFLTYYWFDKEWSWSDRKSELKMMANTAQSPKSRELRQMTAWMRV